MPVRMNASAICRPYTNAEHCWRMSKHAQLVFSAMPSFFWSEHGGAREVDVGRQRAEDDAVDVGRLEAGVGERALRGLQREVAGRPRAVVRDVAALLDAGALLDPRVVGLGLLRRLADVLVVEERRAPRS